jgi:type IV secretory pathway TrbL component
MVPDLDSPIVNANPTCNALQVVSHYRPGLCSGTGSTTPRHTAAAAVAAAAAAAVAATAAAAAAAAACRCSELVQQLLQSDRTPKQ